MTDQTHQTLALNAKCAERYESGFTLIELLIAMAVSALIAVISYQTISQVVTQQTYTESRSDRMQAIQRTVWWMEQDFVQMVPRSIVDQYGDLKPAYMYSPENGVEFSRISTVLSPDASNGIIRVGYKLDGDQLLRLVWPVLDRAPDTEPKVQVLLTGVEQFELIQRRENIAQVIWPTEEQGLNAVPGLVELRLVLDDLGQLTRQFLSVDGVAE